MKYLSLLKSVKTITLEIVGGVEWGWIDGRDPCSPTIIKSFRDASLIEEVSPGRAVLTEKAKRELGKLK